MKKILVANWKMNPETESEAIKLARASNEKNAVICPPFPFLRAVGRTVSKGALGAQDIFWEEKGAYTGEVSARMLKTLGVTHVIVGHSERRRHLGETDQMINKKVKAIFEAGLSAVLCVGEPAAIRRRGRAASERFVESQLRKDIEGASVVKQRTARLVVAYEPVWAIGTGRPESPEDSAAMARFIKNILRRTAAFYPPKVLYGGSVTSANAKRIFLEPDIDGALVGGASLRADEFRRILKARP